ncbi:MAG: cation:proton antiporter [Deltaproteobacteria bacterium]|nr:cation:proton antiporter [Deltaproteobacteria bacterium]
MRLVLLGLLLLLMLVLQQLHAHFPSDLGSRTALVFGFLLLAGFLLGELVAKFSIPRITGYLLAGMACGPSALGFVDKEVIAHVNLVDHLALALIAFTAGAELKIDRLKERIRGIVTIAVVQSSCVFFGTALTLWLLRAWVPIFAGLSEGQILAVSGILAVIASATSPSTAVAVIVESHAKGPVTDSVLGVTVVKDILVLVAFSMVLSLSATSLGSAELAEQEGLGRIFAEVGLSLVVGFVAGGVMVAYLRFVGKQNVLFVVGAAFLLISLSKVFHLDALLVSVCAGFAVANFSRQGKAFQVGLEKASAPIFLIFFSISGAGLNLAVLGSFWHVVGLLVAIRAFFTWSGTWMGSYFSAEDEAVRRHAWTGFLGQAGVSLGLAALLRARLPEMGPWLADIIVGGIVVNQILGPIAFRWALVRVGEANLSQENGQAQVPKASTSSLGRGS